MTVLDDPRTYPKLPIRAGVSQDCLYIHERERRIGDEPRCRRTLEVM